MLLQVSTARCIEAIEAEYWFMKCEVGHILIKI